MGGLIGVNGASVPITIGLQLDDVERRRWTEPPTMAPGATRTEAIIDTGAEMTVITPAIAQALLFERPIRTVRLATVSGRAASQPVHPVRVTIGPADTSARPIELSVVVAELVTSLHGCLLGRDLLAFCELTWSGPNHAWELMLPA